MTLSRSDDPPEPQAPVSQAELRRRWRAHFEAHDKVRDLRLAWDRTYHKWQMSRRSKPPPPEPPDYPPFPEELRELTCGARTRAGTPCKRRDLHRSGRCRLHGGRSTGPTTAEGKRRSALNGNCPKRRGAGKAHET